MDKFKRGMVPPALLWSSAEIRLIVEHRFPLSWTILKEVWYLPHYNEVALKVGLLLKEGPGTVSTGVFFQVVICISIFQGLDKCDSDRSRMSGLNQSLCLVPTNHTYIS